ncbi:zinc-binding lipoprotein ZinT [Klebsiella pneumoniae]|uniref:Zinc-binding lipoprotein ZinT n=1 Tax=Klebsiella pneumoniae TaxID=573 RepID=A0A3S4GM75_KLEPN|nr:zinc-binding lipoprotein ZinT [Klebsiella pneumoniae]
MTRKIPLLALGFGMALASAQAFAHGNHSHGPALTEVERQASEGIFADKDVQDRALSDWEGVWQSVNPYLAQRRSRSGAGAEGEKARRQERGGVSRLL